MAQPELVPLQVTVQPVDSLNSRVHAALASMRNTLRSLEDSSFRDRSRIKSDEYPVFLDLETKVTDEELAQYAIRDAFQAIVRAPVDYTDLLHAMRELGRAEFTDRLPPQGPAETEAFIAAEIHTRTLAIASSRKSSYDKMVGLGVLDEDFAQALRATA